MAIPSEVGSGSEPPLVPSATRLNVGCGAFKKPGFLNVDVAREVDPDLVVDLTVFPYPFTDGQFERIEADHVLEHLSDPFEAMREFHRILAPEGRLIIRVPHFSRGFTHADHKRGFDVTFPYYFDPKFAGGYCGTPFETERVRLTWFAQPYLKRMLLPRPVFALAHALGATLNALANISPYLCSRLWCFWVGGFEEIEFTFLKPERGPSRPA
jgi:SAM-dependent methyltransferase